jgi:hypothetical protein
VEDDDDGVAGPQCREWFPKQTERPRGIKEIDAGLIPLELEQAGACGTVMMEFFRLEI